MTRKVAVLGAGAWGTALADMLADNGVRTSLWTRNETVVEAVAKSGENRPYLAGFPLCPDLDVTTDPARALGDADIFLVAVPSQYIRSTLQNFHDLIPDGSPVVCASKGIELSTLSPMSKVIGEALDGLHPRYAMLSGPSFAAEVAGRLPTSVSLGCDDPALGEELRELFSTPAFRVYSTPDFRGVELGGAVKNVIAIAAGMADGLEFGHDARAALITRGLAEMSRLGMAMGAQQRTFMGLSGMGDLVLTCTGDLSRNRTVGLKLGQGMTLDDICAGTNTVAEGVKTARSLHELAQKLGVELPITEQVYKIIYKSKNPADAVRELMNRELKDE